MNKTTNGINPSDIANKVWSELNEQECKYFINLTNDLSGEDRDKVFISLLFGDTVKIAVSKVKK